jgi:hypothetical protein
VLIVDLMMPLTEAPNCGTTNSSAAIAAVPFILVARLPTPGERIGRELGVDRGHS